MPPALRPILTVALLLGALTLARAAATNPPAAGKTNRAPVVTATNAAPVEMPIPLSKFTVPADGNGRDPFFPDSTRFKPKVAETPGTKAVVVIPDLKINGFSGNPSRPFVIINNVTFEKGDEQLVNTVTGRVRVHCLEINPVELYVIVEVNGARRELRFPKK